MTGFTPRVLPLHTRDYVVDAWLRVLEDGTEHLALRGAVRDQKPPGLYVEGDTEPITAHHMVVDLELAVPSLEILDAHVTIDTHPYPACPAVAGAYRALIGVSIARGFGEKLRELFGGERGCTHTTALLHAMAPVAIQSMPSRQMLRAAEGTENTPLSSAEGRTRALAMTANTCHVWAEGGAMDALVRAGEQPEPPLWLRRRFAELGRNVADWAMVRRGTDPSPRD